jgi:hypothetical protein
MPMQLERTTPGVQVTIPGPLVGCRRILEHGPVRVTMESTRSIDMHLRFQLPPSVLPFKVEQARFYTKIDAPSRRVTIASRRGDDLAELHRVESPLDPLRIDLVEERFLQLDEEGGLHLNLSVSDLLDRRGRENDITQQDLNWTIEYLELEIRGQTIPNPR